MSIHVAPIETVQACPRHLGTFTGRRNRRARRAEILRDGVSLALVLALIAFMAVGF